MQNWKIFRNLIKFLAMSKSEKLKTLFPVPIHSTCDKKVVKKFTTNKCLSFNPTLRE